MEHIEEAGIHSGDSACSLPPHSLDGKMIAELERQTRALALALKVGGLMNVQYAIKDGDIYVLEVNPRASRTVPFVAKVIGLPVAKIAARVMAGETLASFKLEPQRFDLKHRAMSASRRRCSRSPASAKVDTVLGPEMKSTGEVMGIDRDYAIAFAKSQLGGGARLPQGRHGVRLGAGRRQAAHSGGAQDCSRTLGFKVIATSGTQRYLAENGVAADQGQQGGGGPAAHRRCHQKRRVFSWFSTPPRGRRPWPTAGRCGGLPSCIKCRTTPLFQVPSLRRRASRPTSGATSRSARCKAISAGRPDRAGRRRR